MMKNFPVLACMMKREINYIRFGGDMVKSRRDTLLESLLLEVTQYMMVQIANNSDKSSVMRLEVRHTERYNLVMNLMGKIR